MKRPVKNFILAALMISAFCVAGLSSAAVREVGEVIFCETSTSQSTEVPTDLKNSNNVKIQSLDFWDKFRDSVMPDEEKPEQQKPPQEVKPKPAEPPKTVTPRKI